MSRFKALMFYADKFMGRGEPAEAAALCLLAVENAQRPEDRMAAQQRAESIVETLPEGEALTVWAKLYPDVAKLPSVARLIAASLSEPPSAQPDGVSEAGAPTAQDPAQPGEPAAAEPAPAAENSPPESFPSAEAFVAHQRAAAGEG